MKQVRVRFAPSPTGHLHVGGARTAIFNWLFAKRHNGAFIVRVEDTDQERSTRASEQMVLDDLRWLGMQWDEGPEVGGPHAPYRQSERTEIYKRVGEQLLSTSHVYRCFCTDEELDSKRAAAEAAEKSPHYDLTCYRLSGEEVESKVAAGIPNVIRFHVPKREESAHGPNHVSGPRPPAPGLSQSGDVTINDLIRGEVSWKAESLGDFIVLRSDGMPTYNFSVVVDDHEMEISHVIRAEEHLTNTHRQVLLYRAMNWDVPEFAHVSLILGQDRSKLSKRHGATSVSAYAEEGFLPDAMMNYLTLLGWSAPDEREVFTRDYAIGNFTLERVNASPAVFDPQKFEWLNGQYLHASEPSALRQGVQESLSAREWITEAGPEVEAWLDDAIDVMKVAVLRTTQLVEEMAIFFEFFPERALVDLESAAALEGEAARGLIQVLADDLEAFGAPENADQYQQMSARLKEKSGLKGKQLFMPMRVALTGVTHGRELARIIPLLEKGSRIHGLAPIEAPLARVKRMLEVLTR